MKKILITILSLILVLSLTACGDSGNNNDDGGEVYTSGVMVSENKIESETMITKYKTADLVVVDGSDAVKLTFDFTNKSDEPASFTWSTFISAYQNDIELDSTWDFTDQNIFLEDTEIEQEETLQDIPVYFKLNNLESPVTVTVEDFNTYDEDVLILEINLV